MVRFVRNAVNELGVRLASWEGGNMRNAIPSKLQLCSVAMPKQLQP